MRDEKRSNLNSTESTMKRNKTKEVFSFCAHRIFTKMLMASILTIFYTTTVTASQELFLSSGPFLEDVVRIVDPGASAPFCRLTMPTVSQNWTFLIHSEELTADGRLMAHLTAPPGLFFHALWDGPALLLASQREVASGHYVFSTKGAIADAGTYNLHVKLMWENVSMAFAPHLAPDEVFFDEVVQASVMLKLHRHDHPLCRPLQTARSGSDVTAVDKVNAISLSVLASVNVSEDMATEREGSRNTLPMCRGLNSTDNGRWRRVGNRLDWWPKQCQWVVLNRDATQQCLNKTNVMFMGDSHVRMASEVMQPMKGLTYAPMLNAFTSNSSSNNSSAMTHTHTLKGIYPYIRRVRNFLSAIKDGNGDGDGLPPVVVVEFCHWQLRDEPVELYLSDWIYFVTKLHSEVTDCLGQSKCHADSRIILKTCPAYSFRRDLFGNMEYRTNEKIQWAATRQKEFIRELNEEVLAGEEHRLARPLELEVQDTLSFTLPRFAESVDTHHYIGHPKPEGCGDGIGTPRQCPWGRTVGNSVGLADLNSLLYEICIAHE